MINWWNNLDTVQQVFALIAIPSTLIMVIQTIMLVIGMAGDVIDIDDGGQVYVNGVALDEPYTRDGVTSTMGAELPYTVPQGMVYAMGDNRLESKDSRMLGAFSTDDVLGLVVYRISPFERIGRFD